MSYGIQKLPKKLLLDKEHYKIISRNVSRLHYRYQYIPYNINHNKKIQFIKDINHEHITNRNLGIYYNHLNSTE